MSYRLKDATNITLGPAEVLIADSATYINDISPVLTQDNYFAYSESTNIVYTTTYNERMAVDSNNLMEDMVSDRASCTMEMNTVELSRDVLLLLSSIMPSVSDTSIALNKVTDVDFRVEINYNYVDRQKQLQFVFPKVRIRSGLNLVLTGDAEVAQSLYMYSLPVYTSPWENHNLGIMYMNGFQ